jgi:hypothetical protein
MSAAHGKQQARLIEVRASRLHGLGVFAARRTPQRRARRG